MIASRLITYVFKGTESYPSTQEAVAIRNLLPSLSTPRVASAAESANPLIFMF
jgi:hypothetical protein